MPKKETMSAICSQLLTPDDITVTNTVFQKIQREKIVVEVLIEEDGAAIRVYSLEAIMLSDIMPILQHFGFQIIDEIAFHFHHEDQTIYLKRFNLSIHKIEAVTKAKNNIEIVITQSLKGEGSPVSKLFALVCEENITLRQLNLLKAMIDYMNQALLSINLGSFIHTFVSQPKMVSLFLHYFYAKFDPKTTGRQKKIKELEELIESTIKQVPNITDDKILKLSYALLQSTIRTNYFFDKESIAFKIDTASFSYNLKGMQPHIETYVSHRDFSGVHLRMSNVSRGGLRWSERHEDFRTEIKSLMITQEGKNAIIIPDGAKGGFVIHKERSEITKAFFKEVYSEFINNLLDLVDNRIDGEVVRNPDVIAYDDEDAYFVVAADKGTAAMSDVANAISIERNFWLGDAFASGGSNGFGHKELGITAKGALKSTERFFLEKGINFREESVTVVGIGSMNGDVFGNGLLESKHFKLLGAISHREIFIDPDPIPATSYEERQRLFIAKDGSWSAYNASLISKGGGVFLRKDKAIELSAEMQKMLHTKKSVMSGEEIARKLLTLKVDLLFNGGVGTYVKHSEESNLDLGDKQNESVRIDASELQCDVVCEGGNLGFTQRARIEYALNGGKINIDGIDNAAGVDTSDHEVNLKILLYTLREKELISEEERNTTLQGLTQQVVNMVLWSNYRQALALSRDETLSMQYLHDFNASIDVLSENVQAFNRRDFFIPKAESIKTIVTKEGSIARPVLASLLSYSKIFIKQLLLESDIVDTVYSLDYLYKYFPKSFVTVYENEIQEHPLRRQIIATVMADSVINMQGASFLHDYNRIGKDKFLSKIRSYLLSNTLFGANDIRFEIFRHDYKMPLTTQYTLLNDIERTLTFSTKWMLNYLDSEQIASAHILDYRDRLFALLETLEEVEETPVILEGNQHFNRFFMTLDYLRFAVAAIVIKEHNDSSFENVGTLFYHIFREMRVMELLRILDEVTLNEEADRRLKAQMLHYMEFFVVSLTQKILAFQRVGERPSVAFKNYLESEKQQYEQSKKDTAILLAKEHKDLKEVSITINQLVAMAL